MIIILMEPEGIKFLLWTVFSSRRIMVGIIDFDRQYNHKLDRPSIRK